MSDQPPIQPKEVSRSETTRTEIVQAAYRLFIQQGYHGTSVRQVAQSAGIALGSIYNHFPGKEDLFVAVLETYHPYHEILDAAQTARGETIESFVGSVATQMILALGKHPEFLNLMLIEIVEFNSQHIPVLFSEVFPQFSVLVEEFATRDDRLRDLPLFVIMRAFIGLFFSHYITEALIGAHIPPEMKENALDHFIDIFLHGIVDKAQDAILSGEE